MSFHILHQTISFSMLLITLSERDLSTAILLLFCLSSWGKGIQSVKLCLLLTALSKLSNLTLVTGPLSRPQFECAALRIKLISPVSFAKKGADRTILVIPDGLRLRT